MPEYLAQTVKDVTGYETPPAEGMYVFLEVADSAVGMDEKGRQARFRSFFHHQVSGARTGDVDGVGDRSGIEGGHPARVRSGQRNDHPRPVSGRCRGYAGMPPGDRRSAGRSKARERRHTAGGRRVKDPQTGPDHAGAIGISRCFRRKRKGSHPDVSGKNTGTSIVFFSITACRK